MSHRTYKDWVILYGYEPRGYKTWWCRFGQHTYYSADKRKAGVTRCMQCGEVRESIRPNPPADNTIEHAQALCGIHPTKPPYKGDTMPEEDPKIYTRREAASKAVEYAREQIAPIEAAHRLEIAKRDETIHVLRELLKEKAMDIVRGKEWDEECPTPY